MHAKKVGRGRPRVDTEQVAIRFPRDLLDAMDAVIGDAKRFKTDAPSRPELVRIIMRDWLRDNGYLTPGE